MIKTLENTPEKRKIGETVFIIEPWSSQIYEGNIEEIRHENNRDYIWLKCPNFGNIGRIFDQAFLSEADAREYMQEENEKILNTYRNEIESLSDLVRFMYEHVVATAEEYTDWNARQVAREKAFDFGIELEL